MRLSDINPPESYTIAGEGRGKPGHVKGQGNLRLTEDAPGTTTLHYEGDLQVGGMIATVGQRLIEGATKMLVNDTLTTVDQFSSSSALSLVPCEHLSYARLV